MLRIKTSRAHHCQQHKPYVAHQTIPSLTIPETSLVFEVAREITPEIARAAAAHGRREDWMRAPPRPERDLRTRFHCLRIYRHDLHDRAKVSAGTREDTPLQL